MVQEDSVAGFAPGLICALLLGQDSEALGEHAGSSEEREEGDGLLHDGGQHHRRYLCVDHESQHQFLHSLAVTYPLFRNIDNLIGRAAHISFINNTETVRTFILAGKHYFF